MAGRGAHFKMVLMSEAWRRRARIAMIIAPLLIGAVAMWTLRFVLLPFLLGLVIAYLIAPAVSFIARLFPSRYVGYHAARGLALVILYGFATGTLVTGGFVLIPAAIDESEQFIQSLPEIAEEARLRFQELHDAYVPAEYHEKTDDWLADAGNLAGDWAAGLLPGSLRLLGDTVFVIIGYLSLPVWLFFTLKDHPRGLKTFIGSFPPSWRHDVRNLLGIGDTVLRSYLRAVLVQGLVVGVMSFVALTLLDVPFALVLAIIAGFTEMIPMIGPTIGAIPALIVAFAEEPILALWVLLAYLLIQQVENNLIVPKVQGDFLHIHPAVIIVLLVLAGSIGGILLVILIVPLAALVRDLYQYSYLRLGSVPQDIALEQALGQLRARTIDERLRLESIILASDLGNLGYDYSYESSQVGCGLNVNAATSGEAPEITGEEGMSSG